MDLEIGRSSNCMPVDAWTHKSGPQYGRGGWAGLAADRKTGERKRRGGVVLLDLTELGFFIQSTA